METWKQLKDLFCHLQLFHNCMNGDVLSVLCCPCFHLDLLAWHSVEVGNQQNQDIGVSCRHNNGFPSASNAVKNNSCICFLFSFLAVCVKGWVRSLDPLFIAETTCGNYGFVCWCPQNQLLGEKPSKVCLVVLVSNEVLPLCRKW